MNDLTASVGGSAHRAACRTNRAAAVYELPQDYSGAAAAADGLYIAGLAFLDRGSRIPRSQWRSSAVRTPSKATRGLCGAIPRIAASPPTPAHRTGPICTWPALLPGPTLRRAESAGTQRPGVPVTLSECGSTRPACGIRSGRLRRCWCAPAGARNNGHSVEPESHPSIGEPTIHRRPERRGLPSCVRDRGHRAPRQAGGVHPRRLAGTCEAQDGQAIAKETGGSVWPPR